MGIRSGDVLKLAPGLDNEDGLTSLYSLHPYLKRYRIFRTVLTTYDAQESVEIGGDRFSYPIGYATATWTIPVICRPAFDAIMDFIDFDIDTDLEKPVTMRTWTGLKFVNKSGILQFIPPSDFKSNPWEIDDLKYSFYDLKAPV